MKVACLMMQKDETELLEKWILYHGDIFGFEHLYIWDNGSTRSEILPLIEKYSYRGVNFLDGARRHEKYREKGVFIGKQIKSLEKFKYYDFFLPMDCDEFLCLREPIGTNLETSKEEILRAFSALPPQANLFQIGWNYPNNIRETRSFYGWEFDKKFVRKDTFVRMDHGGHCIETFKGDPVTQSPFAFIHFCFRTFRDAQQNARDKLVLTPEIAELPVEEIRKHRVARFLLMNEDEYTREFVDVKNTARFRAPHLEEFFAKYGRRIPFDLDE